MTKLIISTKTILKRVVSDLPLSGVFDTSLSSQFIDPLLRTLRFVRSNEADEESRDENKYPGYPENPRIRSFNPPKKVGHYA